MPLLVAALAPRLLRVAGEVADGTILWMGNAKAVSSHVVPRIRAAAEAAGRPAPRVVAGLPVAVTDDEAEARSVAAAQFAGYGQLPNYRRLLDIGGAAGPADAAIVGDEASVAAQVEELFEAGATDVWAAIFPVGDDRKGSRRRTCDLLASSGGVSRAAGADPRGRASAGVHHGRPGGRHQRLAAGDRRRRARGPGG